MMLPRIQYVTHPNEDFSNLSWIDRLAEGGVRWIQLRIKESDLEKEHPELHYKHTFMEIADLLKVKAKELDMILSINDEVDVARFSEAEGIHLGMEDLGNFEPNRSFDVQGATANTVDEMLNYPLEQIDYFGVGPLRKSTTKCNTKTELGLNGYEQLLLVMNEKALKQPVFAIGGLQLEDIVPLRQIGIYGIAVSGLIHHSGFNVELIKNIVQHVEGKE